MKAKIWIRQVDWNPDGALLGGAAEDGNVYIWDAVSGTLVQMLAGHHNMVMTIAWSPNGMRLVSGGGGVDGGESFLWDPQHGERIHSFEDQLGTATVYSLAWGPHSDLLISGSSDGMLRWWNVQSGECVLLHKAHQGTVWSLKRSPDGTKLASCGDDGAIMIWDIQTGQHLQMLRRDGPYERLNITGIKGAERNTERQLTYFGRN